MPSPKTLVYLSGLISPDAVTMEVRSCRVTAAVWTVTTSLLICRVVSHTATANTAAPAAASPIFLHIFMAGDPGPRAWATPPPPIRITGEVPPNFPATDVNEQHTTDG